MPTFCPKPTAAYCADLRLTIVIKRTVTLNPLSNSHFTLTVTLLAGVKINFYLHLLAYKAHW